MGTKLASVKYSKGSWLGRGWAGAGGRGPEALRLIHRPTRDATQTSNSPEIRITALILGGRGVGVSLANLDFDFGEGEDMMGPLELNEYDQNKQTKSRLSTRKDDIVSNFRVKVKEK